MAILPPQNTLFSRHAFSLNDVIQSGQGLLSNLPQKYQIGALLGLGISYFVAASAVAAMQVQTQHQLLKKKTLS